MFRSTLLNFGCRLTKSVTYSNNVKKDGLRLLNRHYISCILNIHTVTKLNVLESSSFSLNGVRCSNSLKKNSYSQQSFKKDSKDELLDSRPTTNAGEDQVIERNENVDTLASHEEYEDELFRSIDYQEIVGDDNEALNKFKLLLLEIEVLRQDGVSVPKFISTESWKELFALQSRAQRRKLLKFLWGKEIKKLNDKNKKERNRLFAAERREEKIQEMESNEHITYGFQGSTIFLRIYDSAINHFDNCRLVQAMLHSENVVIDCGYDQDMNTIENKLCSKQLCYMFAENRLHKEPFNLHFCNFKRDTVLFNAFKKFIPTLDDPGFPVNVTEESYLDLFPKDKLVYLTPHCRTDLKEFNPDDIYIIGKRFVLFYILTTRTINNRFYLQLV